MSALTLLVLRFGFLLILWAFVFAVVYALRSDLFGRRARRVPTESSQTAPPYVAPPFSAASLSAAAAPPVLSPAFMPSAGGSASDNTEAFSLPPAEASPTGTSASASRLVITGGPKEGLEMPLAREPLTIGRSSESGLVIRDDYTSTHHARLMLWNEGWVIQDLDSTNGTFLNGTRVTLPTPVPLNTPVKIGTTSFELRR